MNVPRSLVWLPAEACVYFPDSHVDDRDGFGERLGRLGAEQQQEMQRLLEKLV